MAESLTHARATGCPLELLDDLRRTYTRGHTGIVESALRANANGPPFHLALLDIQCEFAEMKDFPVAHRFRRI